MRKLVQDAGAVAAAALAAFAITAVGQGIWGVMAIVNVKVSPAIPWAAALMVVILAGLVTVLSGCGWPALGAATRRALVPQAKVTARAWAWSLIAGAVGVVALAALWTVLAQLVRVPPNVLPDTRGVPPWTLAAFLAIAIAAAPLTEELAFRGYAMGLLTRRFGPITALVITAILFAAVHLTQGLSAPKLVVYLLVGLALGYIALRTGSLLTAMVVHSFGDLVFFTTVWSHDASRRLVTEGGADAWFWAAVALLVVAAPLSLAAFWRLAKATAGAQARPDRLAAVSNPGELQAARASNAPA